jgi:CIC family chloride channel protein
VINDAGEMTGLIRLDDMRAAFLQPELADLIIAQDIAVRQVRCLHPSDNLNRALEKMTVSGCAELPVVATPDSRHVLAMVGRHELVQAYSEKMEDLMRQKKST